MVCLFHYQWVSSLAFVSDSLQGATQLLCLCSCVNTGMPSGALQFVVYRFTDITAFLIWTQSVWQGSCSWFRRPLFRSDMLCTMLSSLTALLKSAMHGMLPALCML